MNPPGADEQDDDSPALTPLPEPVETHEKEDISLRISPAPHEGQVNVSSSSDGKTNCSNISPHFLHLNS